MTTIPTVITMITAPTNTIRTINSRITTTMNYQLLDLQLNITITVPSHSYIRRDLHLRSKYHIHLRIMTDRPHPLQNIFMELQSLPHTTTTQIIITVTISMIMALTNIIHTIISMITTTMNYLILHHQLNKVIIFHSLPYILRNLHILSKHHLHRKILLELTHLLQRIFMEIQSMTHTAITTTAIMITIPTNMIYTISMNMITMNYPFVHI